jgi:tRNA-splicing ligase RtcB
MQEIFDPAKQLVPIKAWLSEVDDLTLEQAQNLAVLPFAAHHIVLLPDAHVGYGMPIGGVLAAQAYVVPHAVGVDIGCGMHARRTNIEAGRLKQPHRGQGTVLQAVLNTVQRAVPAGNGPGGNHTGPQEWVDPLGDPQVTALLDAAPPELEKAWRQSAYQLGTLGGGEVFATPVQ